MQNLDSMGVEEALTLFPDQVKETWRQAYSSNIPEISPNSIVITGMGGSSNAAKIIQGLYEEELKIPFWVHNDYGLPAWVNSETLVVANSYSGNTEETLSGVETAKKVGAKILGVATGGKIAEMIKAGEISGAVISAGATNPPNFPKSGLGVSLGALMGVLAKAGVVKVSETQVFSALDELIEVRKNWNVQEIAKWFHGNIPVLFAGRPFTGSLNAGRNAMCEIGRTFSLFFDFPEVNHVLVEATQKPDFVKEKIKYLFFESEFHHDRVKTRYEVTKKIFTEQALGFNSYKLAAKSKLGQALELPHFCAWIGFHLSILDNSDPGPEPWILKLKEALSQPTH